ncbi:HAMP domain-containing sensor histidine kinase [Rhabdaerophilum calidifontis]|uniref:HAMP domain-containing sensor histidine kinase n=1 Tax=Rhabdaerophilum calidifontis TaxID=2604328 RepID=UPI0012391B3E|nr:ATP-binding protein [Rhabdaerophilum calidifontis]
MAADPARRPGAFGQIIRTSAFKLSAVYLVIFLIFAVFVLGYIAWNTRRLLDAQITETIETEIAALAEQYRQGGMRRLITIIERRGRQSGSFIYLLVDARGDSITGNAILRVPALQQNPGWTEARFNWPDEPEEVQRLARLRVFVLPSGVRLFVGRDLEERARLNEVIRRARGWSLVMVLLLGGFGAWFVTKRVLARVDAIAASSARIMEGSLSERLPVSNTDDEFDRLAHHLNQMLDRIGELMAGLRELSGNVAHDLRTPLTRLRNGAEESLRKATTLAESREALERAIEESDQLIRIFDALLMIARAEAGNLAQSLQPLAVDEMLSGIAELYEPLAEEAGMPLSVAIEPGLMLRANRELIGQAIANLLDNALKYGKPEPDVPDGTAGIDLAARRAGETIEIAVTDRGAGIPAGDRERVTERFVRLDPSRAQPGFGLGLSLVAAVARLHGGQLRLEDNAPGLRAVLALPALADPGLADPALARGPRLADDRGDASA